MKKRLLIVLMMVMATIAQAKLQLNVIIAMSEGLKPDCYFADPTWGLVWAETGLPSMRLYGNYEFAYDGLNRDYLKDEVAKISTEEVSTQTTTTTTTTTGQKGNKQTGREDPVAKLILLLFPASGGNINAGTNTKDSIICKLTPEEVAKAINNLHDEKWRYFPLTKNKKAFLEYKKAQLNDKFRLNKESNDHDALSNKISGSKSGLPQGLKDFYIALCGVKQLEGSSLPKGFAEQQLLAFVEERFSTLDEVERFYNNLSKDFKLDNKQLFTDLKVIDDCYLIERNLVSRLENLRPCQVAHYVKVIDLINAKTAYPIDTKLISNGSTYLFNGKDVMNNKESFQDCVDVSMRHIFNLLLWNGQDFSTNLENLLQKGQPKYEYENSPYRLSERGKLPFLSAFYTIIQPTRDKVNDGSIDTRSAWNKVVACLPEETKVNYCEGSKPLPRNELDAGFINMANTIAAVIGEQPCNFDCNDSNVQDKLITKLKGLFVQLAPDKEIELQFQNAEKERTHYGHDDILGTLNVLVSNKNNEKLFDFHVDMRTMHGQVFLDKQYTETERVTEKLEKCDTIEASLALLKPDWMQLRKIFPYNLYQAGCSDNDLKIALLKRLIKVNLASHQGQSNWNLNHWTISPITALFNEIGWEDGQVYEENRSVYQDNIQNILSLDRLRKLVLRNSFLENLEILNCPQLRTLYCYYCDFKSLDVTKCPLLQSISCYACYQLTSLDLTNSPQLQMLDCYNCPKLPSLDVTKCTQLQNLIFTSCDQLTSLEVTKCPLLQSLNCYCCSKLTSLDVTNCTQLQRLNCSCCSKLISLEVTKCPQLQTLDCGYCFKLPSLDVTKCTQLQTLDCGGCFNLIIKVIKNQKIKISGDAKIEWIEPVE